VLLLHALTARAFPGATDLATTAALLHVASPAGAFLAAPYAEAAFAALSFAGALLYASASPSSLPSPSGRRKGGTWMAAARREAAVLGAGAAWGAAALVRSNGVFAGLVFAYDAFAWAVGALDALVDAGAGLALACAAGAVLAAAGFGVWRVDLLGEQERRLVEALGPERLGAGLALVGAVGAVLAGAVWLARSGKVGFLAEDAARADKPSILSTLVGGGMVAAGFAYPQYLAYREYCIGATAAAVWCADMPPSIYTSIQARYWYVPHHE
jgi:hypothetical protein